jgi:ATP-dependent Clp protease ATP-binding subunit ClpC
VGKTETAKQIADALFGSPRHLVRVAMADFTDAWASTRLLGSGPGYVGHEKGGWLVRRLRETPSCVLLLDEFDRAHQAVRDVFLEAFDNARLVDSRGLEANLTHTIVILTSNLGATGSRTPGFTRDEVVTARDRLLRILRAELSAPLVGRLTAVIPFDALTPAALEEILDLKLARLETRLGLEPGEVELEADLRAAIIERGTGPATGARGLDEALEKLVIRPLAARILEEGRPEKGKRLKLGRAEAGV